MPDTKITALTAISTVNPATYPLPIVDTVDTTMAGSGTTKKITINQILGAGGTATLASATITGDLTVRTTGLVVGSTATGIGTTPNTWSGAWKAAQVGRLTLGNATTDSLIGHNFYNDGSYRFAANDFASYYDQVGGAHIWGSSVTSGTAGNAIGWTVLATLNSTGLGVGASPQTKIHVEGTSATVASTVQIVGAATSTLLLGQNADGGVIRGQGGNNCLTFWTGGSASTAASGTGTERMRIDASGNCGIGVTPSAWSQGKALETGFLGNALWGAAQAQVIVSKNAYFNAGWKYAYTGATASNYEQGSGGHLWYTAPSGTAGNAITFTQAMTLDASGRLLVGRTSPISAETFSSNGFALIGGATHQALIGEASGNVFAGSFTNTPFRVRTNNVEVAQFDASGNFLSYLTSTAPTLSTNGAMVFNLTSNTNLRISVRGTDGVTRTANITLA